MCGHFLLLLFAILQVSSATEYYVRPTEPPDSACPGQPCLTLNEYTDNKDHYIKSNTTLIFLPGEHHMDRPLKVIDVKNVTLKSTSNENVQPVLVPRFLCDIHSECLDIEYTNVVASLIYTFQHYQFDFQKKVASLCCSAVHLVHVSQVHINGIQIAGNVSGLIIEQCTGVLISNVVLTADKLHINTFGLLVYASSRILVDSLQAKNFSWGIAACNTFSIGIDNTQIQNCSRSGVLISDSDSVSVVNVTSQYNKHGIFLESTNHTTIINNSLLNNAWNGITLRDAKNSDIYYTFSASNGMNGFYFDTCTDTLINGTHSTHNTNSGFDISDCTNLTMTNIIAKQCRNYGIHISGTEGIMESVYVFNNTYGMAFYSADINMENVSAEHNHHIGIELNTCIVSMALVSSNHNQNSGIHIVHSIETILMNVSTISNSGSGIHLIRAKNTAITLLSSNYNGEYGIIAVDSKHTSIADSHLVHNKGGNIFLFDSPDFSMLRTAASLTAHSSKHIYLEQIIFSGMGSSYTISSTVDPTSQSAIVELYFSDATIYNCSFINNTVSAIKAFVSRITFSGEVTFSHNRALSGTALIFVGSSYLILTENCKIFFIENYASSTGGVIFINTQEFYETSMALNDMRFLDRLFSDFGSLTTSRTGCFIRVEGSRSDTRLVFVNNTAGKGGDVLYGGLVALGYDGDWNCLLSFKNISDMSQQSGLSTITSDPSRVCFCNDGEPDCLTVANPITHHIYPGQTITIPAVVVGQDFGTITGSVYAKFFNTSFAVEVNPEQSITSIEQSQCSSIEYTIFSENEGSEAVLVLAADDIDVSHALNQSNNQEILNSWTILNSEPDYRILASNIKQKFKLYNFTPGQLTAAYLESLGSDNPTIDNFYKFTHPDGGIGSSAIIYEVDNKFVFSREIYGYPVYTTIFFLHCPAGFNLTMDRPFKCDCNRQLQHVPTVKCHIQDQTISRNGLIWIGFDGNETVITSQQCPLDYCNHEEVNVTLDNLDSQCNYNHSGTLCGGCQASLSLVLGSNRCQQCSNTHIALLLPFAMSGIALVFFIKVTDLTVSKGTLNGFIFYANVIKTNEYLFFPEVTPLKVFISWLNLDLGIETCFFDGLSAYSKVWLQFVFPLYIWSIAGLIISLSRYSNRVAKVMGNNSVPVLATLFLFSYAKLLRTIISALSFSILTTADSNKAVWSADGNLDYLGPKHAPLFLAAVVTLLLLWLPYTLVLFLGQWLYRCKSQLVTRMMIKIKPFLDAHFGPMKSNHRYWYGALLFVLVIILLLSAFVPANRASMVMLCITVCSFFLAYCTLVVYHSLTTALFASILYANLGILTATHAFTLEGYNIRPPTNVCIGLAFTQFTGLLLFKIAVLLNIRQRIKRWIHKRGPTEDNGDDDWELYEEAALKREREAEMEREANLGGMALKEIVNDEESANSIVSLPTYGI